MPKDCVCDFEQNFNFIVLNIKFFKGKKACSKREVIFEALKLVFKARKTRKNTISGSATFECSKFAQKYFNTVAVV